MLSRSFVFSIYGSGIGRVRVDGARGVGCEPGYDDELPVGMGVTMARRRWTWLLAILAFFVCLPPAFLIGITLIGHARPLPYVSVWLDRLMLVAISLGLPALAAFTLYRFLVGGADRAADKVAAALEQVFPGKTHEARNTLRRYGTEAHEREQARVHLAIIQLSRGDLAELGRLVEQAKQDRRDILMWAEQQHRGGERS